MESQPRNDAFQQAAIVTRAEQAAGNCILENDRIEGWSNREQ
jgi:hypothetical protein